MAPYHLCASWTPTFLIPPKHNNSASICDAKAPMTAFGQHSMVPPFYANRASVAPCARTARTAREAPSSGSRLSLSLPLGRARHPSTQQNLLLLFLQRSRQGGAAHHEVQTYVHDGISILWPMACATLATSAPQPADCMAQPFLSYIPVQHNASTRPRVRLYISGGLCCSGMKPPWEPCFLRPTPGGVNQGRDHLINATMALTRITSVRTLSEMRR